MADAVPDLPKDPEPQLIRLVPIEDALLRSLSTNTAFVAAFPFLANLNGPLAGVATKGKGCSSCQQNKARFQAFNSIKAQIAGLSDEDKRRFKQMLNARQARVTYDAGSGRIVQRTF